MITQHISVKAAVSFRLQGQRPYQEDSRWPDTDTPPVDTRTFIVCDGVGGAAAGDVASATVCRSMAQFMKGVPETRPLTHIDIRRAVTRAYYDLEEAAGEGARQMATTLTLVHIHPGGVTAIHAGDSRIYLFRPGSGIIYRSNDHSLVNTMVHRGLITPENAEGHPQSNIITRSLSPAEDYDDRSPVTVREFSTPCRGDIILLCSDGVLECICDEELERIMLGKASLQDKCKRLKDICRVSHDNATAMIVEIEGPEEYVEEIEEDAEESGTRTKSISTSEGITTDIAPLHPRLSFIQRIKRIFRR